MSRLSLLATRLNVEDYKGQAKIIFNKDVKFINRKINEITTNIDELESEIEERLSSETPIDDSIISSTFATLLKKREDKKMYENFLAEFYSEPSEAKTTNFSYTQG